MNTACRCDCLKIRALPWSHMSTSLSCSSNHGGPERKPLDCDERGTGFGVSWATKDRGGERLPESRRFGYAPEKWLETGLTDTVAGRLRQDKRPVLFPHATILIGRDQAIE